eukprot:5468878-Pyramimonas_sp.AAC.1
MARERSARLWGMLRSLSKWIKLFNLAGKPFDAERRRQEKLKHPGVRRRECNDMKDFARS